METQRGLCLAQGYTTHEWQCWAWIVASSFTALVCLLNHKMYPTVTVGLEEARKNLKIRTPTSHFGDTLTFHEKYFKQF